MTPRLYFCAGEGSVAVAAPPVIITVEERTGPQPGPNMPIQDVIKSLILFLASRYAGKLFQHLDRFFISITSYLLFYYSGVVVITRDLIF